MKESLFDNRRKKDRRVNKTQTKIIDNISQSFYEDENGKVIDVKESRGSFISGDNKVEMEERGRRSISKPRRALNRSGKYRFYYWNSLILWSIIIIASSLVNTFYIEIADFYEINDPEQLLSILKYNMLAITVVLASFSLGVFMLDKYKKRRKFDRYNFYLVIFSIISSVSVIITFLKF